MQLWAAVIPIGMVLGLIFHRISVRLAQQRSEQPLQGFLLSGRAAPLFWMVLSGAGYGSLSLTFSDGLLAAEYTLLFLVCLSITVIDYHLRKIPNPLLVVLLMSKIVFLLFRHDPMEWMMAGVGFIAGFVLFLLPSYLKISIGGGDIKLAAVLGFYLGIFSLFQAVVVMAVGIAVLAGFLIITKRGTLKSTAAMGPFISMGAVLTVLFPIFK